MRQNGGGILRHPLVTISRFKVSNMDYSACVRMEAGYCGIRWSQYPGIKYPTWTTAHASEWRRDIAASAGHSIQIAIAVSNFPSARWLFTIEQCFITDAVSEIGIQPIILSSFGIQCCTLQSQYPVRHFYCIKLLFFLHPPSTYRQCLSYTVHCLSQYWKPGISKSGD